MIEWSSTLCGILVDKEDHQYPQILVMDEDYLSQVKEDRLYKLLNQEVNENEEKWINYDEEITEVNVELGELVFQDLLEEVLHEL